MADPSNHVTGDRPHDAPFGQRLSLLSGVRVLDLTRFLAGPFASMVLADLGASVLKVEPLTGDTTRVINPYFFGGDSAYFLSVNRNKESIAIDLRAPGSREIMHRLIESHDVILDNMREGQRSALGLSFEDLQTINPRIISCSVTGFGSDGPYSSRPAYDIIVEALGGIMSLTGPEGGPSVRAGVPIGDIAAGLYAAIATLSALKSLETTGIGVHVDVSMLDCQVSLLSYLAQYYFTGGLVARHQGRAHLSIPTYDTFLTRDGRDIVIAANSQEMWGALCGVLGHDELTVDVRFLTPADRLTHREELTPILRSLIATMDLEDLYGALVEADVPVAPIHSIEAALSDEQVTHRRMVVTSPHRSGSEFVTLGVPVKAEASVGEEFSSPPGLGGETDRVLRDLGFTDDEIRGFHDEGIVRSAD
jgi:CoA:oxalate CoA-transferase